MLREHVGIAEELMVYHVVRSPFAVTCRGDRCPPSPPPLIARDRG